MLFSKNSLLLALAVLSFRASAETPLTQPQAEAPKAPQKTSNKPQRIVTAWLGIPENQLTMQNLVHNSLPHLVNNTGCSSFFSSKIKHPDWSADKPRYFNKDYLINEKLGQTGKTTVNILKRALAELATGKSPINNQLKSYSVINYNTLNTLAFECCANNLIKGVTYEKLIGPLKFVMFVIIARSIDKRLKLIKSLKDKNILTYSRSIPEIMRGREYLVFEGPVGYFLRNLPSLASAINSGTLYDCYHHRLKQFVEKKIAKSDELVQFTQNLILNIPFTLPIAPHVYILKSDYDTLSSEQQKIINAVAYEDWFAATKALNNLVIAPHLLKTGIEWTADHYKR